MIFLIQDDYPDFNNATWVQGGGPSLYCFKHPDESICGNVSSYYEYRVHLAPNAAFLAIYGASLVGYIATWIITCTGTAFSVALILGLICEVLGYAGRIMSADNPWDENGFLMQICCLTIGPVFMAAGIYLCLRRIVSAFGPENSRLSPEYYTRIFIPCDVVSLVLQALGGGMASVASHNHESPDAGSNIMIASLAFQVATILGFIVCSLDFALRTVRRYRAMGESAFDQRPEVDQVRNSRRFKFFLGALCLAALMILWRSAFRVAELSEGWSGPVMGDQGMFFGFEGVLIVVAVWALNIFHPVFCMKPLLEMEDGGLKRVWCFRRRESKSSKTENLSDS